MQNWCGDDNQTLQTPGADEKGAFAPQAWNKIAYDPDGKRVLDRQSGNKFFAFCFEP